MLPEKTIKDERPSLSTVPTAWGISFQAFFLYRHKSTFKKANEIDTIPFLPSLLDIYPCQVYINHLYFFLESSFLWWSKVKTCLAKISAHPGAGAPRDHFCHPPGSWRGIPLLLPLACPTVSPPAPCPLTCQCKERSFLSMGSWVMVLL